jgi:hypothetical protein
MSNMRQRIPKATRASPSKEIPRKYPSSSWEITSDDGLSDFGATGEAEPSKTSVGSIPMYDPLLYQSADTTPAPSSNPLSWDVIMDARNANLALQHKKGVPLAHCPPGQTLSGNFIGLRRIHLPSLAPAFVPDSRYKAYMLGRPKENPESMFSRVSMAKFCAKFSIVAVMFLLFVGILIDTQPMFLPGILPKHVLYTTGDRKPQVFYAVDISDRLEQASTAYRTAFLYFITYCICVGYTYNVHWWYKSRWQHYHDIPDNDSTVPTFHNGSDGLLPKHTKYPNNERWARVWIVFHRIGNYLASIWPNFLARRREQRQRFAGAKDV